MKGDFLKKRAQDFLRDAEVAISDRRWNSAAFHLEQVCQFLIKYYLFLKWKDFPKTHSLKTLLEELAEAYPENKKKIKNFLEKNQHIIVDLEQAYITARYLPVEFSEAQVKEMVKFKNNLLNLLETL